MCVCESRVCVCRGRVAELKRHCLISQRRSAGSHIKATSPSDVRLMYWEGEEKVKNVYTSKFTPHKKITCLQSAPRSFGRGAAE